MAESIEILLLNEINSLFTNYKNDDILFNNGFRIIIKQDLFEWVVNNNPFVSDYLSRMFYAFSEKINNYSDIFMVIDELSSSETINWESIKSIKNKYNKTYTGLKTQLKNDEIYDISNIILDFLNENNELKFTFEHNFDGIDFSVIDTNIELINQSLIGKFIVIKVLKFLQYEILKNEKIITKINLVNYNKNISNEKLLSLIKGK